ncbi:hypothetical protein TNCV_1699961 [Trichonephila clavipes]|nr:hypothetical protein TNCV_1699961 [Trichonephila clavipes]
MFGRGLLNLALGAELARVFLPSKKERLFVCPLANLEMAVLDAPVAVEIQKRARFPGTHYQWWEGGIFHSLDSCLLIFGLVL